MVVIFGVHDVRFIILKRTAILWVGLKKLKSICDSVCISKKKQFRVAEFVINHEIELIFLCEDVDQLSLTLNSLVNVDVDLGMIHHLVYCLQFPIKV